MPRPMLVLSLDTSSDATTVALATDSAVLAERTTVARNRHAELLAPAVEDVLREAGRSRTQITDVVVGVGPGPFTSLRVGVVTGAVLADVLGIAVHGVCSLDVIAAASGVAEPFAVATDARRREVYWAAYEPAGGRIVRVGEPEVGPPQEFATTLPVAGAGAQLYGEWFPDPRLPLRPSSAALAEGFVAGAFQVLPPLPLYLRRPDTTAPGPRKSVLPR